MAYKKQQILETTLEINECVEGEYLETRLERIIEGKEPITEGTPLIFTERKDGVQPQYDIRTDKWEIAVAASDVIDKTYKAQRAERQQKFSDRDWEY